MWNLKIENVHRSCPQELFRFCAISRRYLCVLDVDECKLYTPCDKNARCKNTKGSYKCKCKGGYEGNGYWCKPKGTVMFYVFKQ